MPKGGIAATQIYYQTWIMSQKSLVIWASGLQINHQTEEKYWSYIWRYYVCMKLDGITKSHLSKVQFSLIKTRWIIAIAQVIFSFYTVIYPIQKWNISYSTVNFLL